MDSQPDARESARAASLPMMWPRFSKNSKKVLRTSSAVQVLVAMAGVAVIEDEQNRGLKGSRWGWSWERICTWPNFVLQTGAGSGSDVKKGWFNADEPNVGGRGCGALSHLQASLTL